MIANAEEDFQWDIEHAFTEPSSKAADPVGKPLPAGHDDMPTIPPAYNAKSIKSDFFDPDKPEEFASPIRETKYWVRVKVDSVFATTSGMVRRRFPGYRHDYSTFDRKDMQSLWRPDDEDNYEDQRRSRQDGCQGRRSGDHTSQHDSPDSRQDRRMSDQDESHRQPDHRSTENLGKRPHNDFREEHEFQDERDSKRQRPFVNHPHVRSGGGVQVPPPPPPPPAPQGIPSRGTPPPQEAVSWVPETVNDAWQPKAGESRELERTDSRLDGNTAADSYPGHHRSLPTGGRHDSGYHSGPSKRRQSSNGDASPSQEKRPSCPSGCEDSGFVRQASRVTSDSPKGKDRARGKEETSSVGSSDLDDLDREMLGMSSGKAAKRNTWARQKKGDISSVPNVYK